jgi:hypothetical protein
LEGEVLVGETNLRDDERPRLAAILPKDADLINPEGATQGSHRSRRGRQI